MVDLAAEAVPLHERLVRLRAIGAVRPDGRAGVAPVEQAPPQHPAVVGGGVGHLPAPDEAVAPVDAGVALVAEDRDRDVGVPGAVRALARPAEDEGPAGIAVLLAQLRRLVLPRLRDTACLDLRLLGLGVALLRRGDQARVDDLARHRDVAGLPDRPVEAAEQRLDRAGLRQPLAERPDRLRVRHPVGEAEPEEAHEGEPVVDQELGAVVREVVLRLDHQDLEHHDGVERRPAAPGAIAVVERRVELRPEHLEIDHGRECLELIADVAQPPQPIVNVEQPRMPRHAPLHSPPRAE